MDKLFGSLGTSFTLSFCQTPINDFGVALRSTLIYEQEKT
jgi:hypothetical protein